MSDWLSNLTSQFQALPPGRRVALLLTTAGSLAFFYFIANSAGQAEYRVLFRGLEAADAMKVVEGLESENIPYRLDEGGTAIYVPGPLVYEARIRVAGRGLPLGGAQGFEIFDESRLGVTDFVQKVNYQRAVQGELVRSIEQMEAIERARVQIATPRRTGFATPDSRKATASVVLRLHPASELSNDQVRGIVHLIASSVQYLEAGDVTVVDTHGRLLAPLDDLEAGPQAPAGALSQQSRLERQLAGRIESILEPIVGAGRVVATVRAKLDWTKVEQTEERYDPDSQVARSEQRSTESSRDAASAGGVPGVRSNAPGGLPPGGGGNEQSSTRNSETINYEITKVVSHRVDPMGTVTRLNVAVLVDGKPAPPPPAAADGADPVEPVFEPWSDEELADFKQLARRAVGFDDARGDELVLTSAPFYSIDIIEEEGFGLEPHWIALIGTTLNYLGLVVALVLFSRLVGRPLVNAIASSSAASLPTTAGALEASLAGAPVAGGVGVPSLADQVGSIADSRSADSVKTLRGWLDQEG